MGDHGQVEVYSNGSTHTLYEFCGFDDCREAILARGFEIEDDVFARDEFVIDVDGVEVTITVRSKLDESDSCVWCFGCGDFIRHANASPEADGSFFGCECKDPEEDREPMRPLVQEEPLGQLKLVRWGPESGMLPDSKD